MNNPTQDMRHAAPAAAAERAERLGVAAAAVIGWLPVAAFWIYSKQIRIHDRYFPLLSSYSGIDGQTGWIDRIAILRPDLLLALVVIPLLMFIAHYLAPRSRAVRWGWLVFVLSVAILLFANLHSWGTVGRFLTGTALVNAATFAAEQPHMISAYIGLRGLSKLGAVIALSVLAFFLLPRLCRWKPIRLMAAGASAVLCLGAAALAVASMQSHMASLPITRDFVVQAASSLADFKGQATPPAVPDDQLHARFRELTLQQPTSHSPHFGKAAGNDLIVFILETGSARFMDLEKDLDAFPTLKRLSARSAIALSHRSVFPATAESVFSMMTSVYPARSLYGTCIVDMVPGQSPRFAGFVSALAAKGYHTAAYLPYTSIVPLDKSLFGNLGLTKLFYAQQHPTPPGLSRDLHAMSEMTQDIERLIDQGKPYAALFLPQLGHAPWADRPDNRSIAAHGKYLTQVQDEWLGRVVAVLERKGRLDKTTIVITGDHGIRTTNEDPEFASGLIDDYSFRVPLLIHAPAAFAGERISAPSSHLDLSPTLLDLYGIEPVAAQQGAHLWSPTLASRRQFFLANWYFGADGYREGSRYVMQSDVLGLAFESDTLKFSPRQVVRDPAQARATLDKINGLYDLQQQWIERHVCRGD